MECPENEHVHPDISATRLLIIVVIIVNALVFKYISRHNLWKSVITALNNRGTISSMNGDFSVRRHVRGLCGLSTLLSSVCRRTKQLDHELGHAF